MVVDSSALVAILLDEPERAGFVAAIERDSIRLVSVFSVVETSFVIDARKGEPGVADLRAFLARSRLEQVPFGPGGVEPVLDAFRRYGKGRHRAGLNIGDCFAYALAKATGEALLFKGDDFGRTDIRPAAGPRQ